MRHQSFFSRFSAVWYALRLLFAPQSTLTRRSLGASDNTVSDRYLTSLVELSPMYIIRTDLEGRYTFANPAFLNHFVPAELRADFIGSPSLTFIIPQDHQKTIEAVRACFASPGKSIRVTLRKPDVHGNILTTEWDFHIILDDAGLPQEVQCVGMDITERLDADKLLEQERSQQSLLLDNINAIIWEADVATFQFTFVSGAAERITGYASQQWIEEQDFWLNHLHPDDREPSFQYCMNEVKAGKNHELEYRFQKADGGIVWLKDIVTIM